MLSARASRLLDEVFEEPGILVAGAAILAHPQINNKLRAHAKHLQPGVDYAPHAHLLKVVGGFVTGLKSLGADSPGKERHKEIHVLPELTYTAGAILLVLGVRYHAWKLMSDGQSLPRQLMAEVESAFDAWLATNDATNIGKAWASHEAHVDATFVSLTPGREEAELFWNDVLNPLNQPALAQPVIDAFWLLTPSDFAEVYTTPLS